MGARLSPDHRGRREGAAEDDSSHFPLLHPILPRPRAQRAGITSGSPSISSATTVTTGSTGAGGSAIDRPRSVFSSFSSDEPPSTRAPVARFRMGTTTRRASRGSSYRCRYSVEPLRVHLPHGSSPNGLALVP